MNYSFRTLIRLGLIPLAGATNALGDSSRRETLLRGAPFPQATTREQSVGHTELVRRLRDSIAEDSVVWPHAESLLIYFEGGVLTLKGAVPTDSERQRIEALARGAAGPTLLRNDIRILAE